MVRRSEPASKPRIGHGHGCLARSSNEKGHVVFVAFCLSAGANRLQTPPAPANFRDWKHSRQKTGRPCVGRNGTVVSFPHAEQLVVVGCVGRAMHGSLPLPNRVRETSHHLTSQVLQMHHLILSLCCSPGLVVGGPGAVEGINLLGDVAEQTAQHCPMPRMSVGGGDNRGDALAHGDEDLHHHDVWKFPEIQVDPTTAKGRRTNRSQGSHPA